jgi:HAD superfamily hydrolase (TIGR01509 family)
MKQLLKAKAVIFDRDGVIIDTQGLLITSVRYAFKQLSFELQDEDIDQLIGRSIDDYLQYFLNKWDFDSVEFKEILYKQFYSNLDQAPIFSDTINLINNLHRKNIILALTTSAGRDGTLLILNKINILNNFKVIVTKEDVQHRKPDPEPYALTAKKLGIEPKYCVAIEDTALGVESAKGAGIMCIAIPNEYTKHQDFNLADAVVKSAKEIESLLKII